MKKLHSIQILFQMLVFAAISGMSCGGDRFSSLEPAHQMMSFPPTLSSPVKERVTRAPDFIIEYLRKLDGKPEYQPYILTPEESRIISACIDELPDFMKKTMEERLLGMYFVDHLLGSGITEWAVDRDRTVYAFMAYNPSVLRKSISGLLTDKESTCFIKDSGHVSVKITCDDSRNGFLYILLHEAMHLYDYAYRVTPYTDDGIREYAKITEKETGFTKDIWSGYGTPRKLFPFTGKVSFYGLGKGPQLRISDASDIYRMLVDSPYASLYGSMSWAEDLAELAAFYHLTEVMKNPYTISIYNRNGHRESIEPMKSGNVRKRIKYIAELYDFRKAR